MYLLLKAGDFNCYVSSPEEIHLQNPSIFWGFDVSLIGFLREGVVIPLIFPNVS